MAVSFRLKNAIYNTHKNKYNFQCFYCGIDLEKTGFWIDHIEPRSKGGDDNYRNLTLSCPMCNKAKSCLDVNEFLKWIKHMRSSNFKCFADDSIGSKIFEYDKTPYIDNPILTKKAVVV